jgi:hypothetical protein
MHIERGKESVFNLESSTRDFSPRQPFKVVRSGFPFFLCSRIKACKALCGHDRISSVAYPL